MLGDERPPAKLLLVEGQDDKHVVWHLQNTLAPELEFDCEESGSKDELLDAISVEMKQDERRSLGIMMDADDDLTARWNAIAYRLLDSNVEASDQPEPGGTIIPGDLRIGIWLMPDNSTPGELEDFVTKLVPEDDPVWPLAERYIDDIPSEHRKFKGKESRAKLHAWLATRREPRKMGLAISAKDLDAEVPVAGEFVAWLRALFGP